MRNSLVLAMAAVALLLLTALSLLGMNRPASSFDRALAAMADFAAAESALHRDILSARAGLLRNYDPLNLEMGELHRSLEQLRKEGVDSATLAPLTDMVERQDALTEQFKSDNALLQNSFASFELLSDRIEDGPLQAAMTALANSMLRLTLDTSPETAQQMADDLRRLAEQPISVPADEEVVKGLLAHGEMVHDILPAMDHVLTALYALPRAQRQGAVRDSILVRQKASREEARRYRFGLYAISLLLLLLLVSLGEKLRRHMLAFRRRAAFEQTMASISMRFVNAGLQDIGRGIELALEELARWSAADRAYFIDCIVPSRVYLWSRDNIWSPGWPQDASAVATRIGPDAQGLVYVPSVDKLPHGLDKSTLAGAGVQGWICISANRRTGSGGHLGFDSLRGPIAWPGGERHLLRIAIDTIENAVGRARLERDRAQLEARLNQARRMETVGKLTSGIAHNFNNIIGAILGHAEMQEADTAPGSRLAAHVEGVRLAAERGRDLIDQIMTFGRRRAAPHPQLSVRSLMTETVSLLAASLPDDVRLLVDQVPDELLIEGDATQLQQVIMNLCNNAVQAMNGSGAVEVTTDSRLIAETMQFSHGHLGPGRYVCIAVQDSGCGMDASTFERLFEPFFTTRYDGNGLGLATVREIVESHGGAMNVRSKRYEGSVFEVWLPQATGTARPDGAGPTQVRGRGETILLINDDRVRLLHDEEIVAALGYEPVGFADPQQALAAYRVMPQRYDAVLVGHLLPIGAALSLAACIHEIDQSTPILLAASASDLGTDILVDAGVSELVSQPLSSEELASALSRSLTMR